MANVHYQELQAKVTITLFSNNTKTFLVVFNATNKQISNPEDRKLELRNQGLKTQVCTKFLGILLDSQILFRSLLKILYSFQYNASDRTQSYLHSQLYGQAAKCHVACGGRTDSGRSAYQNGGYLSSPRIADHNAMVNEQAYILKYAWSHINSRRNIQARYETK